jgi:L-aspartate oxidase
MARELRHSGPSHSGEASAPAKVGLPAVEEFIGEVRDIMWSDVGIVRTGSGLKRALHRLQDMGATLAPPTTRRSHEARNMHQTGLLIARSALAREESRGAHYRTDFPAHDGKRFLKHSLVEGEAIRFE